MSATLIATAAGLATAVAWGTTDYLGARSTRKLRPIQISLVTELVSVTIAVVLYLMFGFHHVTLDQVIEIVGYSLCLNTAYLIFLKALSHGAVGVVVPLGNIYSLFTLLLAVASGQTHFKQAEFIAILTVIFGAVILAYEKNHDKIPLRQLHYKTMLAFAAAVIWGLGFFILNPVVTELPWQTITITSEVASIILVAMIFVATTPNNVARQVRQAFGSKVAYLTAVVGQIGMLTFYFGSHEAGNVVIPTVLSTCGPLVASFWGRVFDNEKIGWAKRVGAVLVVAGIIAINAS